MGKIKKTKTVELGVKVGGSARKGHEVTLTREDALCGIFGTTDVAQASALVNHCLKPLKADEGTDEHPSNDQRTFMLSVVRDLAPRDAVERMLAVQMAATHVATIRSAQWLANAENITQVQVHNTGYNKLARTFAAQVEALRKHRTGGEQRVTVQHVNVADGGQAIVGNVKAGGRGGNE